jgi:cytidylate kinase
MSDEKKISPNDVIDIMIAHANSGNYAKMYEAVEKYVQQQPWNGKVHQQLARRLGMRPKSFLKLTELNNSVKALVSMTNELPDEHVYLDSHVSNFLYHLLKEWENAEVYKQHNLGIRNRVLLYGPTGNGKTTIAKYIARRAKLPFVQVIGETIIDSHLGNTSRNIHTLLNQLTMPCILFWDEIDSIGRKRSTGDGSSAGHENDRMVNSILVNLEKLSEDVIFIGATNREDVLDPAFKRRFNARLRISEPNERSKKEYHEQLFKYHQLPHTVPVDIAKCSSFSDIKQEVITAARTFVYEKITDEFKWNRKYFGVQR